MFIRGSACSHDSAHASSLAAALREGGPDRPEARSGLVGVHHHGCSGSENGTKHEVLSKAVRPLEIIPLTPAAWRLRSAGAHFVRRPVGLASALRAGGFIPLTPAAWRLRSAGAHFVRRPVGLASALRASDWKTSLRLFGVGERPERSEDKLFDQYQELSEQSEDKLINQQKTANDPLKFTCGKKVTLFKIPSGNRGFPLMQSPVVFYCFV